MGPQTRLGAAAKGVELTRRLAPFRKVLATLSSQLPMRPCNFNCVAFVGLN
jgi:hypothetical protein